MEEIAAERFTQILFCFLTITSIPNLFQEKKTSIYVYIKYMHAVPLEIEPKAGILLLKNYTLSTEEIFPIKGV